MTFGLRDLMLAVGLSATVIASFTLGSWASWFGACVYSVILVARMISLLVGREVTRAASIGFLVPASLYLAATILVSDNEYSFYRGVLPTSQVMQSRIEYVYFNEEENRRLQGDARTKKLVRMALPRLVSLHLFVACLSGYAGAKYATSVYSATESRE